MPLVKYRLYNPGLCPRRTRLAVPGWAGENEKRADGSHEHPWHCIPFSEAATAGVELFYPYDEPLQVTTRDGAPAFTGGPAPDSEPPPFRSFGREYYTYQILIDLKVEPGLAIKVETHPRFFTDTTGTVPIAVPAIIRHWWPMIYFVVFKTPPAGATHIFRPGEPFIQMTVVEPDARIELAEMSEEEAAERELQSERIYASRSTLSADTQWTSSTDTVFDGTYRRIYGAAKSSKR
ncbi:MAG: hypothetical protein JO264_09725 [Acidisphaera sp.]|nr:hypothetical protein [Acidisphaera sp.]